MKGLCGLMILALLAGGCSTPPKPSLSYEAKMKRAETALREDRLFEARRWVSEALQLKSQEPEAQLLMARVIDREITKSKQSSEGVPPEELTTDEKSQQIKTWLERGQGFLEMDRLEEANLAAEEVFQLDPENLEASRLLDQIKAKTQKQGKSDELFLETIYNDEISARIQSYLQQAETRIQDKQWAAARFAVEKILILDPKHGKARRLLAVINEQGKAV